MINETFYFEHDTKWTKWTTKDSFEKTKVLLKFNQGQGYREIISDKVQMEWMYKSNHWYLSKIQFANTILTTKTLIYVVQDMKIWYIFLLEVSNEMKT